MKKLGIFGGTFDPFTLSHREIVKQVLKQGLVDRVCICPTIVIWHRQGYTPWLDDYSKIKTIEAMLAANDEDHLLRDHVDIYDGDLKLRSLCKGNIVLEDRYIRNHRFIDTLMRIKSESYPDSTEYYVIIGPDECAKFKDWFAYDNILKQINGLIVAVNEDGCGRDGKPLEVDDAIKDKVKFMKLANRFNNISASEMRGKYTYVDDYIAAMAQAIEDNEDKTLLKTPIFDIVQGPKTETGLKPIKVDAPDWVMVIVEDQFKNFLVEKQFRYGSNSYVQEFPCGTVEEDEDPLDAAAREVMEETGYDICKSSFIKLGVLNPNPAFMMNKMHVFYVKFTSTNFKEVPKQFDEHEQISFEFVDIANFINEVRTHIADGIQPAMLMSALWLYEMQFKA